MEPVPETERMEEFRSSPLPSLRSPNPPNLTPLSLPDTDASMQQPKLSNFRRSTDPMPLSPKFPMWNTNAPPLPYRPRTTSPLSGHTRSRSTASLTVPMSRAQSLPGVNGAGHILYSPQFQPLSPSSSPNRVRMPRRPPDDMFPPTSPVRLTVLDPSERHISERASSPNPNIGAQTTIPRHRRPSSPLRHFSHSGVIMSPQGFTSSPSQSSVSLRSAELYSSGYAASIPSSVPSTPTSMRSRSPSISSLETIPDSPDAEEAALEAERIAKLKAVAEAAERGESAEGKGQGNLDLTRGRTLAFGSRDKRKRWSVCGAERRGDIDLETIWED
jgi:hypothetical protein